MAIRKRSKPEAGFNMSSMTDIVFLLLIFFMVTSTLINPNALKLLLPQSNNQTKAKSITSISITSDLDYFLNDNGKMTKCTFEQIEPMLKEILGSNSDSYISVHTDRTVDVGTLVKVMNIGVKNRYKMILATSPEDN